jgi:hypothetical protein
MTFQGVILPALASCVCVIFTTTPIAAQSKFDACSLLTAEQVGTIVGAKMGRPRSRTTPWLGNVVNYVCTYRSTEDGWTVEVHIEQGRTAEDVRGYVEALKKVAAANAPKPVSGLGDEALWAPVNPTNGILHVTRGTDVIWVQTYGKAPGAGSLEKTRAITEQVLQQYAKVK